MRRILIILPKILTGKAIMEGFADGFELNKCRVLKKTIDELTFENIENFKPDLIFGHNYSFLVDENCTNIIKKSGCKNLFFYFSDETSIEASLDEKLKKLTPRILVSDKAFKTGFKNRIYLPLAVNPRKYITDFSGYKYPISFVGNPLGDIRQKILCDLVKVFKNKLNIFSNEDIFLQSIDEIKEKKLLDENELEIYLKCRKDFIASEENIAKIYNSSKINLNISAQGNASINYRTFEVLASGGFLVTDEREDLKKIFELSKHLETYKDTNDLIDKIDFYLKNLNIAQKIAQLGKFEVIKHHTFSARVKKILSLCNKEYYCS